MRPNAAVCVLLAGVSLALCRRTAAHHGSAVIGQGLGAVVAAIGTLTVAESLTATDWGIDRLFYFRPLACDADVRMPLITALAFVLFGLALTLQHRGRAPGTSDVLASGTALLTSIPLLGFFYGASAVQAGGRFAVMTPGATVSFTLLCAGFLSYPERRRSTLLGASSPESVAVRRLLLGIFLWPAIGGWALVAGVRVGLYDVAFGTAVLVTLGFAAFAAVILRGARDLDNVRRAREEAELQFRDLIEFSPDGILAVDRNGLIRLANTTAENLFGYPRAELIGQSLETLLPTRFRARHAAHRITYQEQPRLRRMGERLDLWALRKDGTEFPVDVNLGPMQNRGEPTVIAIMRDVTERHEAERALRESEQRYRTLVQNIDEIVYMVEVTGALLAGRVIFVSDRAERTTGYAARNFLENPQLWNSLIHPDDVSSVASLTSRMLRDRTAVTRRYRVRHRQTDRYRWVEDRVVPQVQPDDEHVMLFGVAHDITETVQAEETLKRSEERYREIFMNDLTGAYVATPAGKLIACNPAFASMFGFASVEEALRMDLASIYDSPGDRQDFLAALRAARRIENREVEYRRPDGKPLHTIQNVVGLFDEGGDLIEIRGYLIDTTQRKHLEDQLRQAQKMEAVGQLAGGIAHDFNNLLTAILGYSSLLLERLALSDPADLREDVEEIDKAGKCAADLTQQLLAFSRKQIIQPTVLNLNAVLASVETMLRRVIREDIEFLTVLDPDLGQVRADASQIEQVLMNLVVNARDALPGGGKLTIETANVELDEAYARAHVSVVPGRYVMLAVSDNGMGMTPEIQARLFEPFFTTKPKGHGTGLGLAMVYGIVKQSGGNIWVYSEPEKGTTFKVYLPRVDEPPGEAESPGQAEEILKGSETVLLAEDEDTVRALARQVLTRHGYTVLEARNGEDALRVAAEHTGSVHLLLTDVIMPEMNGRLLARRLAAQHPHSKVLYMSGYTDNAIVHDGVLAAGIALLQKPFTPRALMRAVRKVLDTPP